MYSHFVHKLLGQKIKYNMTISLQSSPSMWHFAAGNYEYSFSRLPSYEMPIFLRNNNYSYMYSQLYFNGKSCGKVKSLYVFKQRVFYLLVTGCNDLYFISIKLQVLSALNIYSLKLSDNIKTEQSDQYSRWFYFKGVPKVLARFSLTWRINLSYSEV